MVGEYIVAVDDDIFALCSGMRRAVEEFNDAVRYVRGCDDYGHGTVVGIWENVDMSGSPVRSWKK